MIYRLNGSCQLSKWYTAHYLPYKLDVSPLKQSSLLARNGAEVMHIDDLFKLGIVRTYAAPLGQRRCFIIGILSTKRLGITTGYQPLDSEDFRCSSA